MAWPNFIIRTRDKFPRSKVVVGSESNKKNSIRPSQLLAVATIFALVGGVVAVRSYAASQYPTGSNDIVFEK
ncbi:MAG: hypothetical protein NVSMB46_08940 [Candidatus Saccharimonadales bacterium]